MHTRGPLGDAKLPQLLLRGEVLRVGRAAVADESGGHRPTVTDSPPSLRLFAYQVYETAEGSCLGTSPSRLAAPWSMSVSRSANETNRCISSPAVPRGRRRD